MSFMEPASPLAASTPMSNLEDISIQRLRQAALELEEDAKAGWSPARRAQMWKLVLLAIAMEDRAEALNNAKNVIKRSDTSGRVVPPELITAARDVIALIEPDAEWTVALSPRPMDMNSRVRKLFGNRPGDLASPEAA